jgi:AraC family transcriptional regulator
MLHHLLIPTTLKCTAAGCNPYARRVVPGDIHLIPEGTEIEFDFTDRADLLVFGFGALRPQAIGNELGPGTDPQLAFHFSVRDAQISSLVHALREELRSDCARGRSYITQLCSTLIRYVVTTYSMNSQAKRKSPGGLPPNRLRFVLDHIHTNIPNRLFSRDLAKLVQMSPQHFGNLFRQSTGFSPYEYVIHERIERGKRLLVETAMPLMEIALELGFAHHSHFGDTFKHVTGMSPKQYRLLHESYPLRNGSNAA